MKITCGIENGDKVWRNSYEEIHRKNGPAVIRADGTKEWWFEHEPVECSSQEEFLEAIKIKKIVNGLVFKIGDNKYELVYIYPSAMENYKGVTVNIKGNKYKLIPVD